MRAFKKSFEVLHFDFTLLGNLDSMSLYAISKIHPPSRCAQLCGHKGFRVRSSSLSTIQSQKRRTKTKTASLLVSEEEVCSDRAKARKESRVSLSHGNR
ncbi:hypothetical protein CEXT_399031 [Caerostris extrusa]|uniref:Uncharacterized protein n=1 Tax=Caerostris extrusa TaxID=172846 RepID=A0AAV4Y6F7_CAEEX|nr:hypothetical protein CEXT_399031 [Caerostris extrusa]